MSETPKITNAKTENEQATTWKSLPATELQDYKNVTNSLMQDALNVWADLWAELDSTRRRPQELNGQVGESDSKAKLQAEDVFEPSCGWPQFLEKMWTLRYYLDFVKRLSQQ